MQLQTSNNVLGVQYTLGEDFDTVQYFVKYVEMHHNPKNLYGAVVG